MALRQTRPYEEDLYVQLDPDDEGYVSPDDLMFLIDNSGFSRPKRIAASGIGSAGSGSHIERGILTDLTSRSVTVEFDAAFTSQPAGNVWAYRMEEVVSGMWRRKDVLFGFSNANQPTSTGFSLTIDDDESLTDVVVEYIFA